jgi:hypothetical protein
MSLIAPPGKRPGRRPVARMAARSYRLSPARPQDTSALIHRTRRESDQPPDASWAEPCFQRHVFSSSPRLEVNIRQTRCRVSQALQELVHRQVRDSTRLNRFSIKPSAVSCVSRTWLVPRSPPWTADRAGRFEMANCDVESRPGRPTRADGRSQTHAAASQRPMATALPHRCHAGTAPYPLRSPSRYTP